MSDGCPTLLLLFSVSPAQITLQYSCQNTNAEYQLLYQAPMGCFSFSLLDEVHSSSMITFSLHYLPFPSLRKQHPFPAENTTASLIHSHLSIFLSPPPFCLLEKWVFLLYYFMVFSRGRGWVLLLLFFFFFDPAALFPPQLPNYVDPRWVCIPCAHMAHNRPQKPLELNTSVPHKSQLECCDAGGASFWDFGFSYVQHIACHQSWAGHWITWGCSFPGLWVIINCRIMRNA